MVTREDLDELVGITNRHHQIKARGIYRDVRVLSSAFNPTVLIAAMIVCYRLYNSSFCDGKQLSLWFHDMLMIEQRWYTRAECMEARLPFC